MSDTTTLYKPAYAFSGSGEMLYEEAGEFVRVRYCTAHNSSIQPDWEICEARWRSMGECDVREIWQEAT